MTRYSWPFALALTAVVFGARGSWALDARLSSGEARWREGAAAFARRIAHKEGALQRINAAMAHLVAEALNPGDSGGPLVAMDGTVLGVNTSIASASGGSEGIGFAISADAAKEFVSRRRAGKAAQPACPDPGRISKDWDELRTSEPPPGMVAAHHAAARAAAAPLLIEIAGRGYWLGMSHRSDRMAEAEREPGCFASGSAAFYYVGPAEEPELDFAAAAAADERALLPRLLELRWLDPKTGRRVRWVDTSLGARIGWASDGRGQPADWPIPLPAGLNTLY